MQPLWVGGVSYLDRGKMKMVVYHIYNTNNDVLSWHRLHPLEFDGEEEQSCVEMKILWQRGALPGIQFSVDETNILKILKFSIDT